MTSPAQKAAGEILKEQRGAGCEKDADYLVELDCLASIIQQAITEAVDAAVAQERARYKGLAEEFRLTGVGSDANRIYCYCARRLEAQWEGSK